MKFLHTADLHIGKRIFELSLMEDQAYILKQILELIRKEQPDAVLLAGDIYDKAVPSAEAVQLFDEFLYRLSGEGVEIRRIRKLLGEKVARTYARGEIEALTENSSEALTPYVGRGKKIRMRDFVSRKKGGGYILVADKDGCTEMALVELGLDALDVFQTAMPEKYRL